MLYIPQRTPIIVRLPIMAKADTDHHRRMIYCEASIDDVVDRENEIVALEALWRSRDVFLGPQGNLDIAHWSWLPNPSTGRPDPGYIIGKPVDVAKSGSKLLVAGEISRNLTPPPVGAPGFSADAFWHSIYGQDPPVNWFPSVYGFIKKVEMLKRDGVEVRRILECEWVSLGFWQRVQHPSLGPVQLNPYKEFAKADQAHVRVNARQNGALTMTLGTFAKACGEGLTTTATSSYETNPEEMAGGTALRSESLNGSSKALLARYPVAKVAVLTHIQKNKITPTRQNIHDLFKALGHGPDAAEKLCRELGLS